MQSCWSNTGSRTTISPLKTDRTLSSSAAPNWTSSGSPSLKVVVSEVASGSRTRTTAVSGSSTVSRTWTSSSLSASSSVPLTRILTAAVGLTAMSVVLQRRDDQRGAAADVQRVVDPVGLGDHAPAGGVAVRAVGDRGEAVAVLHGVDAVAGLRSGGRVGALLRAR